MVERLHEVETLFAEGDQATSKLVNDSFEYPQYTQFIELGDGKRLIYGHKKEERRYDAKKAPLVQIGTFIYQHARAYMYVTVHSRCNTIYTDTDSALIELHGETEEELLVDYNRNVPEEFQPKHYRCCHSCRTTSCECVLNDDNSSLVEVKELGQYENELADHFGNNMTAFVTAPKQYAIVDDDVRIVVKAKIKGCKLVGGDSCNKSVKCVASGKKYKALSCDYQTAGVWPAKEFKNLLGTDASNMGKGMSEEAIDGEPSIYRYVEAIFDKINGGDKVDFDCQGLTRVVDKFGKIYIKEVCNNKAIRNVRN